MNKQRRYISVFFLFFLSGNLFAKTPERVVGLSKSVAEMWLLAGGEIAGTTTDGLELAGTEKTVSVGTLTTSSLEAIVALNPDLVILTKDIPLHKKLDGNLRALGIKTYVADVKSFWDYEKVMADFTKLTGRKDLYKKNAGDVKVKIEKIKKGDDGVNPGKKESYLFFRVSSAKNKVLKDHFGNEIFQDLGLVSVIQDDSVFDELSIEAIVAENPDWIFVTTQGDAVKSTEIFRRTFESNPVWRTLNAVKKNRVVILPSELFNYKPNARWAEAYEYINDVLEK